MYRVIPSTFPCPRHQYLDSDDRKTGKTNAKAIEPGNDKLSLFEVQFPGARYCDCLDLNAEANVSRN